MTSGYKIRWTSHALKELEETYNFLEKNWTTRELKSLSIAIEQKVKSIAQNPYLFQVAGNDEQIRRAVVAKLNSLYYRIHEGQVEILSFYANRKKPKF